MVLVFGGTTEGRKAVEVLEQAGTPYYYSTRGREQEVELVHGQRLTGTMTADEALAFCREHAIRLLVDASHPFAEELHRMVAVVAGALQLPAIRFERIFPDRSNEVEWVDRVEEISLCGAHRVLSTLGVKSITSLRPLETTDVRFFYRILPRESSIRLAHQQGATDEQLCFYQEGEDEAEVLRRLCPDVVLVKESGLSGGFQEKVNAAKALGIRVIAIRRPATPALFCCVNGPHGLRRAVERLLPDFYPLKSGLTTGTCATAAAVAALHRLQTGQTPSDVPVRLPNGETVAVPVGFADDFAYCIKDAGDDPDVTNGLEVQASLQPSDHFEIRGSEGVGRFTLPGFDFPPGEPAINRAPRQMLRDNIPGDYIVTIGVKGGAEIARRTFNPRLGIEGGISIIGVSGIVQPYSEEAFLESIRKCLEVAKASGAPRVVIGSGAKSENALRTRYPELPTQAFVQYGNFVGETLRMAAELGIQDVILGVMLGKAVKLAAGQLDTHSRRGTFNRDFVRSLLAEAQCDTALADKVTLVRELWELLAPEQVRDLATTVLAHCRCHCQPLLPAGRLTILLVDDEGRIWE